MIWLWRISSSLAAAAPLIAATLAGSVQLVDSRDPGVRKHRNYSGVVVWLEPLNGQPAPPPRAPQHVEMVQKGKRFIPHVLAIPAGTKVDFPNFDPIFHNAFSNFSGQRFDVGLYRPGSSQSVWFRREGIVRVFCNIHPTMSAIIAVLKTPWFAVTRTDGAYQIGDVPPGEYTLRIFHERASPEELKARERRVSVSGTQSVLPPLTISETGYIQAPHRNKYGKEYPPAPEDTVLYPGGKK